MFYNNTRGDNMAERIIFHIDVNNAFLSWTAVKLLKNGYQADIIKLPSIICGDESKRHGIVLAKSPVAKKYNIVTAETIYQAKKKCPNLQMFPPDYKWYKEKSTELFTYLSKYSPTIEVFSIDECFIDMTGTKYLYKDYLDLAYRIKDEIKNNFGYTVNIGIGNNKLCAKMASDFEKPDKVHTLFKNEIKTKLWPLPVNDLLMVGQSTKNLLNKLNIYTIGQLANTNDKVLQHYFKNQATYLKNASWGIDTTEVCPRSDKTTSISISETLPHDCTNKDKLKEILLYFTEQITMKLRQQHQYAKTVAIFYKNNNFEKYSSQAKLENASNNTKEIYKLVIEIFEKSYKDDPIRLIGLRLADLSSTKEKQLTIFENNTKQTENEETFQKTIDAINQKFGKAIVTPASLKIIGAKKKEDIINTNS